MKTYKEMAESVLRSVNEYKIRRNIRNEILRKAIPLCCLCVLLATGGIFWGMGGYEALSPANTEGESKTTSADSNIISADSNVTSPESTEPDINVSETNSPLSITVSVTGACARWIPYRYENGYVYFKFTCFDSVPEMETAKDKGRELVLGNMDPEEEELWKNYLDIEIQLLSITQGYLSIIGENYKALLNKVPKDGEPLFDLYRDQVDCYYDKKLLSEETDITIKDGMILREHIVGAEQNWESKETGQGDQTREPEGQSLPEEIPDALEYGGIYETSTVGEFKDKLSFLDRESIRVYEIIPVDLNSDPPATKRVERKNEDSDFMGAYGIRIECDYQGETYVLEYYADSFGSPRSFKLLIFALKRDLLLA
ncbi:MAG: hypothetical protein K2J79_05265 [Ruminiclostridium sp.]|nr:hypothetical protein [Ruminiclostridium sp.]